MNTKRKYYYLLGDAEVVAEETYKDDDDNFSLFQLRVTDSDWIICKVHKINIEALINSLNYSINKFKF